MKNTLMVLLVSLLLSFSLTACGGDSQTGSNGANDGPISGDTAGTGSVNDGSGSVNGDSGSVNGGNGTVNGGSDSGSIAGGSGSAAGSSVNGGAANGSADGSQSGVMPDDSLVDDARSALDDAGNAVGRAMEDF